MTFNEWIPRTLIAVVISTAWGALMGVLFEEPLSFVLAAISAAVITLCVLMTAWLKNV